MSNSSPLLSEAYRAEQERLHATTNYGTMGESFGPLVTQIVDNLQIGHLLDYGCGSRMSLLRSLKPAGKLKYQGYDPGVPEMSSAPIPAQMVTCIDVLEHIEPEYLDNVLDHLQSLTEAVLFASVHTGPAQKVLSDGRNAHLIQQPMEWWLPKLWSRFDLHTVQVTGEHGFYVIAYAKPRAIEGVDGDKLA